jgi:hypothetical protein
MNENTRVKPAPTQPSSLALFFAIRGFACTPADKLVLFQLLSYANRSGNAHPSEKLMAYGIGVSDRTVLRAILRLEKTGVITVDRKQKFNRYQFHLRALLAQQRPPMPYEPSADSGQLTPVSPNQLTPVSPNQEGQLTLVTATTDISEPLGDTGDQVRCHPCHTKRILKRVEEERAKKGTADFVFSGSGSAAESAAEQVNERDSGGMAPAPFEVSPEDLEAVRQVVLPALDTKDRVPMYVLSGPAMSALRKTGKSLQDAALIYRAAVQRLVADGIIGMQDGKLIRTEDDPQ